MTFCSHCGHHLEQQIPQGDSRLRDVCPACKTIHYQNPKIVAGCIPVWGDQVLLCRRAIEPRRGFWTLPAGFMENGESMAEAAMRETLEEACARVKNLNLYSIFDLPHISQVHTFFRAELSDLSFDIGVESLEVALFHESEIPWQNLAFPTIGRILTCFFQDRNAHHFPVRNESLAELKPYFLPLNHA